MLQSFKDEVVNEEENLSSEKRALLLGEMQSLALPSNWKILKIGDLGRICGGGTPSTKISEYWGSDIPWVTPGEISQINNIFISTTERKITNAGLVNSSLEVLPIGTVLMTSRATIGEVAINTVPMTTNQGFINILCDAERVNNLFLAYWIMHNKQKLEARGSGSTFRELSKSNFKTILVVLPPLSEQRAIAYILQTVQQAIQSRRKELELERERKAALVQHLFTHGTGNELTKLSKVGEVPKSWEVLKLSAVVTLQRGFDITLKGTI